MSKFNPQPGDRIKFVRDLTDGPSSSHPACTYATKNSYGWIDRIGGCWEGYWVYWDHWGTAAFGCQRKDFLIIDIGDEMIQHDLPWSEDNLLLIDGY